MNRSIVMRLLAAAVLVAAEIGAVTALLVVAPTPAGAGLFEDLFPSGRGRPSIPADVVASVMVLQALEGLSDRDAVTAATRNSP